MAIGAEAFLMKKYVLVLAGQFFNRVIKGMNHAANLGKRDIGGIIWPHSKRDNDIPWLKIIKQHIPAVSH